MSAEEIFQSYVSRKVGEIPRRGDVIIQRVGKKIVSKNFVQKLYLLKSSHQVKYVQL